MSVAAAARVPAAPVIGVRSNEDVLADYARTSRPELIDHLVRVNQPLVHHILKRFAHADESYEDLVQVANLGLLKAAQNFDVNRGVRFSTYATAMIEGEVRHHLRDSLLLRQPRWARRLYAQIQQTMTELQGTLGRPPELDEVAEAMNIEADSIAEVLAHYQRIDLCAWDEEADDDCADIDRRAIRSRHYSTLALPIEDRVALEAALERLTDFQRRLVELLFYREFTQREVAEALGVTTRKVGTEAQRALARLRELMGKRVF